ncbi:MAG: DUF5916 domain-containing protein [Gemmatimonadota bacterium]
MVPRSVRAPARSAALLAVAAAGVLAPAPALAQDDLPAGVDPRTYLDADLPTVSARRITAPIVLDGRLDEALWSQAEPAGSFVQTEPYDGRVASEPTEVRVLYDDDALYVGARMHQTSGDVRRRLGARDAMLSDSDWFYVMLDSYHDHQTAFKFSVNPAGVKRDEIEGVGRGMMGRGDTSWDAVWDVATRIDEDGWTAEIRIPFSQLRFRDEQVQTWGVQFSRRLIADEETVVLAHTPKSQRGGVARYGHLVGLEGIRPGKRTEILPYLTGRFDALDVAPGDPFRDGSDGGASMGADLKYRVTSSLTLDATINPDFGQVEVDPAVVNLSANETSLDEKRPFFVEGDDVFQFRGMRLFYSRRIGRQPQGSTPSGTLYRDVPGSTRILGAAKLSGKTTNGWNVGVLNALTAKERADWIGADESPGSNVVEPLANYFIARAEKQMRRGESSTGGILTLVNRRLDGTGLDGRLRATALTGGADFSHQFLRRSWQVSGYATMSQVRGSQQAMLLTQRSSARYFHRPDADHLALDSARTKLTGYAARVELRKSAGLHWRGDVNLSATSPGFEINDFGFQTGVDRVGTDVNFSYVENTPGRIFRSYWISSRTAMDWNYGGDRTSGRTTLSFRGSFTNYWGGNVSLTRSFEAFDDRLTRGGPMAFDPAGYNVRMDLNSDSRKALSLRGNLNRSWGDSGGWRNAASVTLTARPAENWSVTVGPDVSRSRTSAQYVTSVADEHMPSTYGRRYIFAPIQQTTVSMDTRLNVNFTPALSLDLYAQPFVSTADYGEPMQLAAPRSYDFEVFGTDVGTLSYDAEQDRYAIDPDGSGPARGFTFSNRDFNRRSLRGNAVLRWEWRPGSNLFLVWQQSRSRRLDTGEFSLERDVRGVFDSAPESMFMLKVDYWLNL